MEVKLHIFAAPMQKATRFKLATMPFWVRVKPNRLLPTTCCRKRRPAKNLLVQAFYDKQDFYCKPGKGCREK